MARKSNFSALLLLFGLLVASDAFAQISGTLHAPDGTPQAGVVVFLNRTTLRSVTDDFGQFIFQNVPAGFHELVAYKKGFALYRAPMRVQADRTYNLNLTFASTEKKARGKSTSASEAALSEALFGSEGLMLYNPDTRPEAEVSGQKFRVLSGPVVMEYPNAGYRVTAYFSSSTFQSVAEAAYSYEEYQGSNVDQNMAVERARQAVYAGSLRHWLSATVAGTAKAEGFVAYDPSGQQLAEPPAAVASATPGYFRINLDQPIEVQYRDQPKTKLSASSPVDVSAGGIPINAKAVLADGPMNRTSLAQLLPIDYRPLQDIEATYAEALRYFYEKVYVQTDKPYYYPGEPLWFKAYINYYNQTWRDSLSDVLYVELLSASQEVKRQFMFRIDKGVSKGDFIFPDSLEAGTYYLRAYTNLRLNFGNTGLFTKPLRVLSITDKVDPISYAHTATSSSLTVTPKQKSYRVRDKITLDLHLEGAAGNGASLSVAVTDAVQVIAIPEPATILNNYPINANEIPKIRELDRRIERGVSFFGQFVNNKGLPEKTQLSFIQWKTGDFLTAETGDDGMFWQTGLQFTDSAKFSYKSDKAKGRPYGKVNILPREIPPLEKPDSPELPIVKVGAVQRVFSEYEVPKDSKLLEAVEVRSRRTDNEEFERGKKRPYGRADQTLTTKNLNLASGNILYALAGKVPGLVVNPVEGTIYYSRAMGTSFTQSPSPLVTVNDIPMAGEAGPVLLSLDINNIESIEFTKRINVLYGAQGNNGVIAVYTKMGAAVDTKDPNFQTIHLPGFSRSRTFIAPTHDQPKGESAPADYRSTLYWNPDVNVDASGVATLSFFASDLAGIYRVVVEGVTSDGKPVRAETYLSIEERP